MFHGSGASGVPLVLDGDSVQGTSPMETLLLAVGGCMAIDVLVILEKSRVPVTALSLVAEGLRAESDPKRFESMRLIYEIEGPEEEHEPRLTRAIDLSRDKYCSVLHTLRPDLELTIEVRRG
jgi:putative redox protein